MDRSCIRQVAYLLSRKDLESHAFQHQWQTRSISKIHIIKRDTSLRWPLGTGIVFQPRTSFQLQGTVVQKLAHIGIVSSLPSLDIQAFQVTRSQESMSWHIERTVSRSRHRPQGFQLTLLERRVQVDQVSKGAACLYGVDESDAEHSRGYFAAKAYPKNGYC